MISVKFEQDAIDSLSDDLKLLDVSKIFLVTGKKSYINSGSKEIIENLDGNFEFVRFYDFEDNPNINDVEKGVNFFKENNCDCILAIGGGSSIDIAKLIKFFNPKIKPYEDKFNQLLKFKNDIPLIAIPTTAGTGSEATQFAVMYVGLDKYSISDKLLLPNHVAVISKLHVSQTKYQKAVSGLDAFSQSVESFWSINSTDESRKYSLKALELIIPNLPKIVNEEANMDAHQNMALGAYLAGKAINIAKTTAPHAFSYYLTKRFNLPHGHAVAIFLPSFVIYNLYLNNNKNYDMKYNILVNLLNKLLISKNHLDSLSTKVKNFILNLGVELDINKLSISKEEIILAFKSGNQQRLKNNPREFNFNNFIEETAFIS